MKMVDAEALQKAMGVHTYTQTEWTPATAWGVPIIDAEPVVRCKECIHRWVSGVAPRKSGKIGNIDYYLWIDTTCPFENTEDDFFCAKGEKNETN